MIDGFSTGIRDQEELRGDEFIWKLVQGSVFRRLMEEGVSEIGRGADDVSGNQVMGQLVQITMSSGNVENGVSGVTPGRKSFRLENGFWHLVEVPAKSRMMKGSVTRVVAQEQRVFSQDLGRKDPQDSIFRRGMERGITGRISRHQLFCCQRRCLRRGQATRAQRCMEIINSHTGVYREKKNSLKDDPPKISMRSAGFDLPTTQWKTRSMNMKADSPVDPAKPGAILLVDDEQPILESYKVALSPFYELVTATSTREAEFHLHKKAFKVVVADHLMPGGNGMSFLVRCREEYPHMQRVLVTGYMKPEMLLRSVNEAALYRYLLKPAQIADLVKIVHDAVKAHDLAVKSAAQ